MSIFSKFCIRTKSNSVTPKKEGTPKVKGNGKVKKPSFFKICKRYEEEVPN